MFHERKKIKMKKLFSLLTLVFLSSTLIIAQDSSAEPTTDEGAEMTFESTEVDYGTIEQNSDPLRIFHFTNTGNEPLVIKHAKGSCGCTVPTYPKHPIMPGEKAEIEVRYDTKRIGRFTKTVTLTTNETAEKRVLKIKGEVLTQAKEEEPVPASAPSIFNSGN